MSKHTLTVQAVTMTPETATEMLGKNTNNRNVSRALVERLKLSLERDEWVLNGESIKIGTDGRILDGQHRLIACVETGANFDTFLVTGLPPETQFTMDTGKARTLADMLKLRGDVSVIGLASIIGALIRTEKWGIRVGATQASHGYPVTIKEGLDYRDANPWLPDLERHAQALRVTGLTQKIAGLLYHTFSTIDSEDAEYFFARLVDGADLSVGDPILTLRNWLLESRKARASSPSGINSVAHLATYMTAYTIKAWNAYRDGERLKQLKFRVGGANPETFPEPR